MDHSFNTYFVLFALIVGPLICASMVAVVGLIPKFRKSADELRADVKHRNETLHG